ncbi:MAG: permease prefix domain 2-containing transporter [Bacteroidota bacterium]
MKSGRNIFPPRWAQRFVEWYCKPEVAEDLLGDLNEYFERNVETKGARRAKIIYIIDAFKFFRTYTVRRPNFVNVFINWIMIGSYIKNVRSQCDAEQAVLNPSTSLASQSACRLD